MGESSGNSSGTKQSEGRTPMGLAFDPTRAPVTPKDAATVLVLREENPGEVELFCVRRNPKSQFMGGVVVFPGGKVDPGDADPAFSALVASEPHPRVALLEPADPGALLVAAARETIEEAGLLPSAIRAPLVEQVRAALDGGQTFAAALAAGDVALDLGKLIPFGRWVTPAAEQRRFDARFFLMACPEGQEARACLTETTLGFWATPKGVLERFARGEIQLAPPTTRCLEILATVTSIAEALAIAERQSLLPVCPQFVPGDPPALVLPGDPAHEVSERRVDGPTRFVLRDGRFVSEDPR